MTTLAETVQKLAEGRTFSLKKGHYSLTKTALVNDKFTVYEVEPKKDPTWDSSGNRIDDDQWKHSTVIRLTELHNEEQIRKLFEQFDLRKTIDNEKCSSIVAFHDQGIFGFQDKLYHATRYDEPFRDLHYWITVDHVGAEIDILDVYRLARGCLEVFEYLGENGYVLTQFDEHNVYATSLSEDRANFFKVMFKGQKKSEIPNDILHKRHRFSPPETETKDIYKSYSFSLGLMLIWVLFETNNKAAEFPKDLYTNPDIIGNLIQACVEIAYKSGAPNQQLKESFRVFLEDLLQVNQDKRKNAKELLTYKWIIESDKLDYEEYKKECEEYQKALAKEKEENEKNF